MADADDADRGFRKAEQSVADRVNRGGNIQIAARDLEKALEKSNAGKEAEKQRTVAGLLKEKTDSFRATNTLNMLVQGGVLGGFIWVHAVAQAVPFDTVMLICSAINILGAAGRLHQAGSRTRRGEGP